jgi:hypothetical protein
VLSPSATSIEALCSCIEALCYSRIRPDALLIYYAQLTAHSAKLLTAYRDNEEKQRQIAELQANCLVSRALTY